MILPPALVRLRLRGPQRAWPTLWLPLFLLWPLLLLLFVLAATCGVLVLFIAAQVSFASAIGLLASTYRLLCSTRGTHVDVVGDRAQVLITVY